MVNAASHNAQTVAVSQAPEISLVESVETLGLRKTYYR